MRCDFLGPRGRHSLLFSTMLQFYGFNLLSPSARTTQESKSHYMRCHNMKTAQPFILLVYYLLARQFEFAHICPFRTARRVMHRPAVFIALILASQCLQAHQSLFSTPKSGDFSALFILENRRFSMCDRPTVESPFLGGLVAAQQCCCNPLSYSFTSGAAAHVARVQRAACPC